MLRSGLQGSGDFCAGRWRGGRTAPGWGLVHPPRSFAFAEELALFERQAREEAARVSRPR